MSALSATVLSRACTFWARVYSTNSGTTDMGRSSPAASRRFLSMSVRSSTPGRGRIHRGRCTVYISYWSAIAA
eukprot:2748103-Prymnesium_polylepis.7